MQRTQSSLHLGNAILHVHIKIKFVQGFKSRLCIFKSYSIFYGYHIQIRLIIGFFLRRNNQKKFKFLEKRFKDTKITSTREFRVLKALQKRMVKDFHQSEIALNYLEDKFGTEPAKKCVNFTSLCYRYSYMDINYLLNSSPESLTEENVERFTSE